MTLEVLDRHSEVLFEFLWCSVYGQEVFTHIPFEGVFCKNCNTQVELQDSRETRGYEEAVLACFDTDSTWNLHVDVPEEIESITRGLAGEQPPTNPIVVLKAARWWYLHGKGGTDPAFQ